MVDLREAAGSAVVTGASRGIGRAIAAELAVRGFQVVATMRDPAAGAGLAGEVAGAGGSIRVAELDVTQPDRFAWPDDLRLLVNNAGVRQDYLPVEETPPDEWRAVFAVNVFGPVELIRRVTPILRANGGGVICNVTSAAILGPKPFFGTYSGSKAALSAITEVLALELAPFGIRMIEVMPGPVDTDMARTSVLARPPDAARFDAYRPMASRWSKPDLVLTPTGHAARMVADAILSEDHTLRYGCDPLSVEVIDRWRASSDQQRLDAARAQYAWTDESSPPPAPL